MTATGLSTVDDLTFFTTLIFSGLVQPGLLMFCQQNFTLTRLYAKKHALAPSHNVSVIIPERTAT